MKNFENKKTHCGELKGVQLMREPIRYPRNGALAPEDVLASGNAAAAAFPSLVHHNSVRSGIVSTYLIEFT